MKTENMFSEEKKVTKDDLEKVSVSENNESLIDLRQELPFVHVECKKDDMFKYVGNRMLVREGVSARLKVAFALLKEEQPDYGMWVCYGYRHPKVQRDYFNQRFKANQESYPELSKAELIELTHTQVAVPSVAGHPTGGAVDLTIVGPDGIELDMGTGIADYSEPAKCYTFAEGLTGEQMTNRRLLRYIMLQAGFAPFDGEWWHFSYGDREWAFYYGYPKSLYNQIERSFVGCD